VLAVQYVPIMVLSPYAGTIVDRMDKRRLVMLCAVGLAATSMTLGVVTATGAVRLWMVFAAAGLTGLWSAFDTPARMTIVGELVDAEHLANAVVLNNAMINGARIAGPAIAGVVITTLGVGACFMFNASSYVAVLVAMSLLRREALRSPVPVQRRPRQLRDGIIYVWRTVELRATLIVLTIVGIFTIEFPVTIPLLAEFTFDGGSRGLALLTVCQGIGAIVGGLALARNHHPTEAHIAIACALFGVFVTATALAPNIVVAAGMMAFVGAASTGVLVLSSSALQLRVGADFRGRVLSLYTLCVIGSTPIGGPIVGYVGQHVNPRAALLLGGAAALASGLGLGAWLRRSAAARASEVADPEVEVTEAAV
jgi:MFS family permease